MEFSMAFSIYCEQPTTALASELAQGYVHVLTACYSLSPVKIMSASLVRVHALAKS